VNKVTTLITGILTLILAIFAFVLSFSNLYKLAAESGVAYPALIPLMIEGAVVVFSVAMLRNSLHNDPVRNLWILIIGSSSLATAFNVYHSDTSNLMSMIMAGVPSVFLLLSFETFISQIKKVSDRAELVKSLKQLDQDLIEKRASLVEQWKNIESEFSRNNEELQGKLASLEQQAQAAEANLTQLEQEYAVKRQKLEQEITTLKDKKKPAAHKKSATDKRRDKVAKLYDPAKTLTQLAQEVNAHENTVRNDLKILNLNGK
jgi:hypothetical protein